MEIQVKTRSKAKKAYIEAIAAMYTKELNLGRSKGTIVIHTVPGMAKEMAMNGGCIKVGDGLITVAVDSRLSMEALTVTVAHEMVHAKQYLLGQLRAAGKGYIWCGKKYANEYFTAPWEIEAYRRERILANAVARILFF